MVKTMNSDGEASVSFSDTVTMVNSLIRQPKLGK